MAAERNPKCEAARSFLTRAVSPKAQTKQGLKPQAMTPIRTQAP